MSSRALLSSSLPRLTFRTTGITASVVERMEETLKQDVLREIRSGDGKLLLHDEVETKPGNYEIIPIWEAVEESDVMTPKELYKMVMDEAYNVDYQRVAVVSPSLILIPAHADNLDGRASSFACDLASDCAKGGDWIGGRIRLCVCLPKEEGSGADVQIQLSNG